MKSKNEYKDHTDKEIEIDEDIEKGGEEDEEDVGERALQLFVCASFFLFLTPEYVGKREREKDWSFCEMFFFYLKLCVWVFF